MEISPTIIYFIMQADTVCCFLQTLSVGGFIFLAITKIFFHFEAQHDDFAGRHMRWRKWCIAFMTTGFLAALIPNTSTLSAMYILPALSKSQAIQKDFPELYDAMVKKLKEQLK